MNRPEFELAEMSSNVVGEINKRMTMNMLIQGAAAHASLTVHHLVRDELNSMRPAAQRGVPNTLFYDRFATGVFLGYWNWEMALLVGEADRFWRRVESGRTMFGNHPLLVRHGRTLANSARDSLYERADLKRVQRGSLSLSVQLMRLCWDAARFEKRHHLPLLKLAIDTISDVWGIEPRMMHAQITELPEFGEIRQPRTMRGKMLRHAMAAWGGVLIDEQGKPYVSGRSQFWNLLLHELTKGTVELICLHGLNKLDDDVYEVVMEEADQIEFEIWMLQSGLALFRLVLDVVPRGMRISQAIMHVAKMPAAIHEKFSFAVIEHPDRARRMLANASRES